MSQNLRDDVGWQGKNASDLSLVEGDRAVFVPTVFVPLDGSVHASMALPVARAMADIEGATLHIVHVYERTLSSNGLLLRLGLGEEQLRNSIVHQVGGTSAAGVARLAKDFRSSVIVTCTHTCMARPQGDLGLFGREMLRLAPCPVLLVPPRGVREPWRPRRMLLPHDGAPSTATALGAVAGLARRSGAEVTVLHVATPTAGRPVEPGTLTGPLYVDRPYYEWPAWTAEFLARLFCVAHIPPTVNVQFFLEQGEPGAEILRFAAEHDIDLIVLGWQGRLEPERATTIKTVIRESHCPVLVARVLG